MFRYTEAVDQRDAAARCTGVYSAIVDVEERCDPRAVALVADGLEAAGVSDRCLFDYESVVTQISNHIILADGRCDMTVDKPFAADGVQQQSLCALACAATAHLMGFPTVYLVSSVLDEELMRLSYLSAQLSRVAHRDFSGFEAGALGQPGFSPERALCNRGMIVLGTELGGILRARRYMRAMGVREYLLLVDERDRDPCTEAASFALKRDRSPLCTNIASMALQLNLAQALQGPAAPGGFALQNAVQNLSMAHNVDGAGNFTGTPAHVARLAPIPGGPPTSGIQRYNVDLGGNNSAAADYEGYRPQQGDLGEIKLDLEQERLAHNLQVLELVRAAQNASGVEAMSFGDRIYAKGWELAGGVLEKVGNMKANVGRIFNGLFANAVGPDDRPVTIIREVERNASGNTTVLVSDALTHETSVVELDRLVCDENILEKQKEFVSKLRPGWGVYDGELVALQCDAQNPEMVMAVYSNGTEQVVDANTVIYDAAKPIPKSATPLQAAIAPRNSEENVAHYLSSRGAVAAGAIALLVLYQLIRATRRAKKARANLRDNMGPPMEPDRRRPSAQPAAAVAAAAAADGEAMGRAQIAAQPFTGLSVRPSRRPSGGGGATAGVSGTPSDPYTAMRQQAKIRKSMMEQYGVGKPVKRAKNLMVLVGAGGFPLVIV